MADISARRMMVSLFVRMSVVCSGVVGATGVCVRSSNGESFIVMQDGSGDAVTISGAVSLASEGDSIIVGPGTYPEEVTVEVSLTIVGRDGPATTTIDAEGFSNCLACPAIVPDLQINGLTLCNAEIGYAFESGYAIQGAGEIEVRNCSIRANEGGGLYWAGDVRLVNVDAGDMDMGRAAIFVGGGKLFEVTGCRFHELVGHVITNGGGVLAVRECEFADLTGGWSAIGVGGEVLVEGCVFRNVEGSGIGPYGPPVHVRRERGVGGTPIDVQGSTFAKVNQGAVEASDSLPLIRFKNNIVTGGMYGVINVGPDPGPELACNDVWGNSVNWLGMPDPSGLNANFSAPPLYCDPSNGDLRLGSNSPCLPENNTCGVLVGALGVGCGVIQVENVTWGQIKASYRR